MSRLSLVALVPVAALAMACSAGGPNATPKAEAAPAAPAAAQAQVPAPGGFTGTVAETMDAGRYTYVKVDTGQGEIWAATNKFAVKKGDRVHVPDAPPMVKFHSDSLDRTFDKIYFVGSIAKVGDDVPDTVPADSTAPNPQVPHTGAPSLPAEVADTIAQPAGADTVAEIHAQRTELNGKQVTVRGKVVKVNKGIMGTNWYHLQDGTGNAAAGTHDLAVTSDGDAAVGDVVTATGTLAADKDFGMGYKYEVILENATLKK